MNDPPLSPPLGKRKNKTRLLRLFDINVVRHRDGLLDCFVEPIGSPCNDVKVCSKDPMPLLSSSSDFWSSCLTGRLASLDVGKKTVGIAFSDPRRVIASPFKTLPRTRWKTDGPLLCDLFHQQQVKGLVIGWPLNMDDSTGPRCHATRHFAENLLSLQDFTLILWDERLSTVAATRILRDEADLSRQRRAPLIDTVDASLIFESFLATERR